MKEISLDELGRHLGLSKADRERLKPLPKAARQRRAEVFQWPSRAAKGVVVLAVVYEDGDVDYYAVTSTVARKEVEFGRTHVS